MLSSILLTSLLASLIVAQSNSSFDASQIPLTMKNQWCQGEQTNCPILCGGSTQQNGNTCDGLTLKYTCLCPNGSQPANIGDYSGTLPNYICQATFAQCQKANAGTSGCTSCSSLQPSSVPSATSSAPSSSGAASTSTVTESVSATGATASKAAAETMRPIGGAALVGGMLAGLLL